MSALADRIGESLRYGVTQRGQVRGAPPKARLTDASNRPLHLSHDDRILDRLAHVPEAPHARPDAHNATDPHHRRVRHRGIDARPGAWRGAGRAVRRHRRRFLACRPIRTSPTEAPDAANVWR